MLSCHAEAEDQVVADFFICTSNKFLAYLAELFV